MDDRVIGLAAEVAFFALFALPPSLLAFLGAAGWIGDALGSDVTERVIRHVIASAATFLTPRTVHAVVAPTVRAIMEHGRADVFSVGVLFALWSASRSAYVVIEALLIAYDLELDRSLWRRRVQALAFTLVGLVVASFLVPLVVVGPRFGASLAAPLGLSTQFATIWHVAYWPLTGILTVAVLTAIYHFAIPWRTPFIRDVPGACLALLVWIVAAVGLRTYVSWAFNSDSVYGSLGSPVAIMLWLYVTAFAVLIGAELNAEIEKLWPTVTADEKWAAWTEATGAIAARQLIAEAALERKANRERRRALRSRAKPRGAATPTPAPVAAPDSAAPDTPALETPEPPAPDTPGPQTPTDPPENSAQ